MAMVDRMIMRMMKTTMKIMTTKMMMMTYHHIDDDDNDDDDEDDKDANEWWILHFLTLPNPSLGSHFLSACINNIIIFVSLCYYKIIKGSATVT